MTSEPNKSDESNRRPATPFIVAGRFQFTSCALPIMSAAIAHLGR